jgi:CHAT domain-containing protein
LSELLLKLPKRIRALTIIPDDVLFGVPFAAITANGRPILQSHSVTVQTYLPSREAPSHLPAPLSLVAAGISEAVANLSPLPGVMKEIRDVSDLFSNRGMQVLTLLNVDATKANIARHLKFRSIVHLACHGVFSRDDLEKTGLALYAGDRKVELVSLLDLAKLDLTYVEHLTLASCWSADNYILPGRCILSLPQVALHAGAKSVLGSLWPLDDKIAAAFARRFYEHLLSVPREEALRRTQLECLQNKLFEQCDINTSDAFYWAGYTLFGEPTRIFYRNGNRDAWIRFIRSFRRRFA